MITPAEAQALADDVSGPSTLDPRPSTPCPSVEDPEFAAIRVVNYIDLAQHDDARRLLLALSFRTPVHRLTTAASDALAYLSEAKPETARWRLLLELRSNRKS